MSAFINFFGVPLEIFKDKPKSEEEKTKDEMDKIITQINQAF